MYIIYKALKNVNEKLRFSQKKYNNFNFQLSNQNTLDELLSISKVIVSLGLKCEFFFKNINFFEKEFVVREHQKRWLNESWYLLTFFLSFIKVMSALNTQNVQSDSRQSRFTTVLKYTFFQFFLQKVVPFFYLYSHCHKSKCYIICSESRDFDASFEPYSARSNPFSFLSYTHLKFKQLHFFCKNKKDKKWSCCNFRCQ